MGRVRGRRAGGDAGGAARASLYDEVTARIAAELEAGRFPWVQPWDSAAAAPGLPRNAASNRAYSGINVLILWGEGFARGYASQGWLTFRQAIEAGGCVRKGEHGVGVVYADRFTPEAEKERAAAEGDAARAVPFLKRFTLFNVAQVAGLPERMLAGAAPLPERELVPVAEALIAACRLIGSYDSVVAYGQSRALVVWQRIVLPNGSSIRIDNVPATDMAGYAGLADKVDAHTWQLLKGVALSTLLGVGTELSLGDRESDLVRAIRESAQQGTSRAGDQIVTKNLNVQPTIKVRPGWPLRVVVHKDIVLAPWPGQEQ